MPDNPFSDPEIDREIAPKILRLQQASLEWDDDPDGRSFDDFLVQTLEESLNAHAEPYLHKVDSEDLIGQYREYLRGVGSALIRGARERGLLSDPYSEGRLREMAENSGRLMNRILFLKPEERESEIQNEVERLRAEFMPKAVRWRQWRSQILSRIEARFEARYRHWTAEAIERVQRQIATGTGEASTHEGLRLRAEAWARAAEGGFPVANKPRANEANRDESTRTDAEPAVDEENGNGADRRAVIDAFISKLAATGRKVTRKNIWTVAGYTNRTEFERFQSDNPRTTAAATKNFERVLKMSPEEFLALLRRKQVPK
jgi:hypothetical protein